MKINLSEGERGGRRATYIEDFGKEDNNLADEGSHGTTDVHIESQNSTYGGLNSDSDVVAWLVRGMVAVCVGEGPL